MSTTDDLLEEAKRGIIQCADELKAAVSRSQDSETTLEALAIEVQFIKAEIQLAQTCALVAIGQELRLGRRQAVRASVKEDQHYTSRIYEQPEP